MAVEQGGLIEDFNARFRQVVWNFTGQSEQVKDCAVIDQRRNTLQTGAAIRRAGLGLAL